MSMLASVHKGPQIKPRRTVLYGVHGIGKSTWGSKWPNAIFIPTEDGISDLDVHSFPLCKDAITASKCVLELVKEDHDYKTVVVDTADWLERLIWQRVCEQDNKEAISDFGYGAGYEKSAAKFKGFLAALDHVREKGMHVVILAHCEIKRFENPEGDSYDRYVPKLHRSTSALLQEWADEVLFACYKTLVRKEESGFNKERGIGISTGERIIRTTEKPAHLAKNRLSLPEELPFDFKSYAKYLKVG